MTLNPNGAKRYEVQGSSGMFALVWVVQFEGLPQSLRPFNRLLTKLEGEKPFPYDDSGFYALRSMIYKQTRPLIITINGH